MDTELPYELWDEAFSYRDKNPISSELKVVLFLYLMCRRCDYGWNISTMFQKAIAEGKWTDRRGLGDLKYENKVESALKQMEQGGMLLKCQDVKTHTPALYFVDSKIDTAIDKEMRENPRRKYYCINPMVLKINTVTTDINRLFMNYDPTLNTFALDQGLRFIQDYNKKELEVIELINRLKKLDFLTVFTTLIMIYDMAGLHMECIHRNVQLKTNADIELDKSINRYISTSFFNNGAKFESLKNKYMSSWILSDILPENDFWEFQRLFKKTVGERITREIYFNRAILKKS